MIRRRNNGSSWQTPLPSTVPKKRATTFTKNQAGTNFGAVVMCFSLLCIVVICGALFHSALRVNDGNSFLAKSRHVSSLLNPQGREIHGYRRENESIKYVNLSEMQSPSDQYDVIVVGCGPAGLTAALFASRMGMSVLVIGSPSTGSLSGTDRIDNFPSFFGYSNGGGQGWIDATMHQASSFGATFAPPTLLATGLVKQHTIFELHLGTETKALGKSVIIASGSVPRKLSLPHESTLWGHTLHNCALCDGDIYVGDGIKKSVAVIGGGDAAVEAIFLLHKLGVDAIHWIHRRQEYRASQVDVERVQNLPNVDVWTPFVVVEWMVKEHGDGAILDGIRIVGARNGVADPEAASTLEIPCDGAFLMIGSTPNSEWLQTSGIDIDPGSKLIRLTSSKESDTSDGKGSPPIPQYSTSTSIQGVFAAGEVVDEIYRQALTASSEGAKSAIDAQRYLRHIGMETSVSKQSSQSVKDAEDNRNQQPKIPEHKQSESKSTGPVDCDDLAKPDCIKQVVSAHPVVVFSKSYCPHCRRALEAIRSFTEPLVLELTDLQNPMEIQDTLAIMTGRRTVPNVFVGGVSIGGGDETTALYREGRLESLLRKAGAI